jgi:hypothetical protein
MLLFTVVSGSIHLRNDDRTIVAAIERHLSAVLAALEEHQEEGRLPSAQWAGDILSDEVVARKVRLTSLFVAKDLLYNPSRPLVGSDAIVLGARVGLRLFAIRANNEASQISDSDPKRAGLVPLSQFIGTRMAEPAGTAPTGSQPVRSETNRASSAAGSGR